MNYKLKNYAMMEFGMRKDAEGNPHQEDCIFPAAGQMTDSDRLFVLCDGMGGHDAGEVASATVCEVLGRMLSGGDDFSDDALLAAIDAAYDALDAADTGAEKKMGTTLALLRLHSRGASVAHIGDSRVYHIRPGRDGDSTQILSVTEDHSLVNDLIKIGELTREEARHSTRKNVITRAMQPRQSERCKADIAHITDIRPGDYFYLCSDGMLEQDEMDSGEALRNIFSDAGGPAENKLRILRRATDANSDNHTAIVVHVVDTAAESDCPAPEKQPAAKKRRRIGLPAAIAFLFLLLILLAAAVYAGKKLGWGDVVFEKFSYLCSAF